MEKSFEGSMSVLEKKKTIQQFRLLLSSKMGPFTPLTKQENDELLKYVVDTEKRKKAGCW